MFLVGIIQKTLLGFYQPRALCSLSLQTLLSRQQDLSFFTPRCCVQNYAFVFLWRQSCEFSSCTLSHKRRNGLKTCDRRQFKAVAKASRRSDVCSCVVHRLFSTVFCCQHISEVQLRHWRPAVSQFCTLVQQDADKNQTPERAGKVTKQQNK